MELGTVDCVRIAYWILSCEHNFCFLFSYYTVTFANKDVICNSKWQRQSEMKNCIIHNIRNKYKDRVSTTDFR